MNFHRGGIAAAILSMIDENLKGGDRRPGGASTPWTWTWALPTSSHAGGAGLPVIRMMMMGRRSMMILLQAGQGNGESREAVKQRVLGVSRFSEIMFITMIITNHHHRYQNHHLISTFSLQNCDDHNHLIVLFVNKFFPSESW